MIRKRIILASIIWLICFAFGRGAVPVLFFSDLTDGPTSGWEQSDSVGAAVTIWGLNFGDTRGASYVTCGGVNLTSDSNYAEWGAHNAPSGDSADQYSSARGLERITFWLDSTMSTGADSISVTISEGTSNWLPFYLRETGNIYFISRTGNDDDSGFYADTAGHGSEGPWLLVSKVRTVEAGDVVYFREGIWTEVDAENAVLAFINTNHNNGQANKTITIASYPGEIAQLGDSSNSNVMRSYGSDPGDTLSYWTFSKFMWRCHSRVINYGSGSTSPGKSEYQRFVGNDVSTYNPGAVGWGFDGHAGGNHHLRIYGNHFHDCASNNRGDSVTISSRAYSFYVEGYGHFTNMDIGWNEFTHDEKGRVQIYGHLGSTDYIDTLYFHDNYIHDMGMAGLVAGGGDTGGQGCYNFLRKAFIYNNIFANNSTIYVNGDIRIGSNPGGHLNELYIYNNTFYGNDNRCIRIEPIGECSGPAIVELKNNIFYTDGAPYYDNQAGTDTFFVGLKNTYYGGTGGVPSWDDSSYERNPKFSTPGSYDFTLQATSPCIDSAATITLTISDYDGVPRPQGTAFDMGAYEYKGNDPKKYPPIRRQ